jgi:hypothetical protein
MEALSNFFLTPFGPDDIVPGHMKNFATVRGIGTRLKRGMRVLLEGEVFVVKFVNECRAFVEPEDKNRTVTIEDKFSENGEKKTFQARRRGLSISPNSDVEIL